MKKTLHTRAEDWAMRVVPMVDDPEQYRKMLAWVKHGYLTGYRNGERKGKRSSHRDGGRHG